MNAFITSVTVYYKVMAIESYDNGKYQKQSQRL